MAVVVPVQAVSDASMVVRASVVSVLRNMRGVMFFIAVFFLLGLLRRYAAGVPVAAVIEFVGFGEDDVVKQVADVLVLRSEVFEREHGDVRHGNVRAPV